MLTGLGASTPTIIIAGACDDRSADAILFEYRAHADGQADDDGWRSAGIEPTTTTNKHLTSIAGGVSYDVAVTYRRNKVLGPRRIVGAASAGAVAVEFDNIFGTNKPDDNATRNVPRGEWSPTIAYDQGDIVTYEGSSYIAGQDVPAGTFPTNSVYWDLLAEGGADGTAGIPGPAGATGRPSYLHVAYASSADGSQGFVTGISNPGRDFIGIYTDATSAGSSDYHAYFWSRLTGEDGTDGTNGTPGPIGPDGRQSYVHFAYADSADGSSNFTTGAPGSRAYIGVYSDYSEPDSSYPGDYAWSLIKGPQGIAGPPAANGQPSYVHIAYANSADGSQDFVAGAANPGRVYIGIYSDSSSYGSTYYGSYNWSRLTGQNGINGTNGTPGPVGANGQTTYVHFAYADSADGSQNFTSGDPGSRTYIGVYTDYTLPDSNSYGAYAWSRIKGADGSPGPVGSTGATGSAGSTGPAGQNGSAGASAFTLYNVNFCDGPGVNSVTKIYGNDGWNGKAATTQKYPACTVSGKMPPGGFIGLDNSPLDGGNTSYTTLDLAWHRSDDGGDYWTYWDGSQISFHRLNGYGDGTIYTVIWDGSTGYFLRNGNVEATYQLTYNPGPMCGTFCLLHQYGVIYDIAFSAGGPAGNAGTPGPPGVSPAPSYAPVSVYGEGTTSYSGPIPLPPNQTLNVEGYVFASVSSAQSANVTLQTQYRINGGGWNVLGSTNRQVSQDDGGVDLDVVNTIYNNSGVKWVVELRVQISRGGNSNTQYSAGFLLPGF